MVWSGVVLWEELYGPKENLLPSGNISTAAQNYSEIVVRRTTEVQFAHTSWNVLLTETDTGKVCDHQRNKKVFLTWRKKQS